MHAHGVKTKSLFISVKKKSLFIRAANVCLHSKELSASLSFLTPDQHPLYQNWAPDCQKEELRIVRAAT